MVRREEGRREQGSVKGRQPLAPVKAYAPAATPWQGGQGWRGTRRGRRVEERRHGAGAEGTARSGRSGDPARASVSACPGPAERGGGSPRGGSTGRHPSGQTRQKSGRWPESPARRLRNGGRPSASGPGEGTGQSVANVRCRGGCGCGAPLRAEGGSCGERQRSDGGRPARSWQCGRARWSARMKARSWAGGATAGGPRRAPRRATWDLRRQGRQRAAGPPVQSYDLAPGTGRRGSPHVQQRVHVAGSPRVRRRDRAAGEVLPP